MDDLLADFLTETNENLAELDVALLALERTPDDAPTLGLIFRMVHTIKGTCGFLGLPRLERVAHAAENVLGQLRDGTMSASPDIVSQILVALDRIKAILAGLSQSGAEPTGDDARLIADLNATASGHTPAAASAVAEEPPPPARPEPAAAAVDAQEPEPPRPVVAPPVVPSSATPTPAAAVPGDAAAPGGGPAAAQTIRVTVDVLEDLMTLVSELVLTRNQLLQLARMQENSGFTAPLQRLSHITSELQEGVMKTRMQPVGNAWNKLPRLVRDLAHDLNKKIELVMLGADTELERVPRRWPHHHRGVRRRARPAGR